MKNLIIALSLIVFSGGCNGLHETLHYHYQSFQGWFPSADAQYWNPAESWTNKYKNGDPDQGPRFFLSTTVLVAFTDAKHLLGELHRDTLALGMWFFGYWYRGCRHRHHFLLIALCAIGLWVVHALGFHFVYSLLFG